MLLIIFGLASLHIFNNGTQYNQADMHKIAHSRPHIDIIIIVITTIDSPVNESLVILLWFDFLTFLAGSCLWHTIAFDCPIWLWSLWWSLLPFSGTLGSWVFSARSLRCCLTLFASSTMIILWLAFKADVFASTFFFVMTMTLSFGMDNLNNLFRSPGLLAFLLEVVVLTEIPKQDRNQWPLGLCWWDLFWLGAIVCRRRYILWC